MKIKFMSIMLMALFLVSTVAFTIVPAMAITLVPIIDDDVIPGGPGTISGYPTGGGHGDGVWDRAQDGLVVERGDGFVAVCMPDGRVSPNYWGVHAKITFRCVDVTDVKSWENDLDLTVMDTRHDITVFGPEDGDDGSAFLGDPWDDEVDWYTDLAKANPSLLEDEVEFWLTTSSGRDSFIIYLDNYEACAAMYIELINSLRLDDPSYYGVGDTTGWIDSLHPYDDGVGENEWLPLVEYIEVDIDIKPGSDPNSINLGEQGILTVAVLGSADFDVTTIDETTVELGGIDITTRGKTNKIAFSIEDVNGDGYDDFIAKFRVQDLVFEGALTTATTELTLTGELEGGIPITGTDFVRIVPP